MEIISWPLVALIFGVIVVILFKKPLSRLIDRTEKVSKEGILANKGQEQFSNMSTSKVDEFLKVYDNQLLVEIEKLLNTSLENLHPRDATEREKFLLRNLSQVSITLLFEKTYYAIYKSQILALKYLNENRTNVKIEQIRPFYDSAAEKYSSYYNNYSFDSWLEFMITTILVKKNGNEIGLTLRGKEFLKYLIDQGYSTEKFG